MSAARRVSSTSSQSSSVSFSRASTVSSPRPSEDCERASRERRRTSRPADGGGVSKTRPGSGSAGGSSTVSGGRPRPDGVAPDGRGGGVSGGAGVSGRGGRSAGGRGRGGGGGAGPPP